MARIWLLLALIFTAATPFSPGTAPPEPQPASTPTLVDPEFLGMAIRDPWYDYGTNPKYQEPHQAWNKDFQDTMGQVLEETGVRWVRLEFHIPVGYSDNGQDTTAVTNEIEKYDYFINEVAPRHNLKVLALLGFALLPIDPRLLNDTHTGDIPPYGGGMNTHMRFWLDRALMIAERYKDRVAAYEVLNEQNRLPPNGDAILPDVTGRLITKFYRFCHNIAPVDRQYSCGSPQIILGGIHPRGTGPIGAITMTDVQYLQAIYRVGGPFDDFWKTNNRHYYPVDGIGYHPYPHEITVSISNVLVDLALVRMRNALSAAGDGCQQFWITEVGYNSAYPGQSEVGQAAFLRDVYTTLPSRPLPSACGPRREVANVFWFKYEDFPPDSGPNAQRWGIVHIPFQNGACPGGACYDINGTPAYRRLVYHTYREIAGLPVQQVWLPFSSR